MQHDEEYLRENICGFTERNCLDNHKVARDYHDHMMRWRSMDNEPTQGQWIEVLCDRLGHIHTIPYRRERTKETDLGWRPAMPLPEPPSIKG